MNAIKFIQQHGIDKAREIVDGQKDTVAPNLFKYFSPSLNYYHMLNIESNVRISELKRLVESVDLVTAWGGLESTYSKFRYAQEHKNTYAANMIQQAIADCEAIYGDEHV